MLTELKNLKVAEVSLVTKPANKRKFLIFKEEGGLDMLEDILKSLEELDIDLENEDEVENLLQKAKISDKAMNAVKGALKILSAHKDELPKQMMKDMAAMAGYGYAAPKKEEKPKEEKPKEEYPKKQAKPKEEYKPMKKEDGSLDIESIPEESRSMVEMLWKEHESAIKKADQLEADLKVEREIRVIKEYQERGAKFPNIGTSEVVGAILKTAYEVSAEYGLQVETSLKDADAKIEKSDLFKEIGSEAIGTNDSAWAKIEELAKSYVAKGEGQSMAQAVDRVLAEHPKLYEEYTKERGGK